VPSLEQHQGALHTAYAAADDGLENAENETRAHAPDRAAPQREHHQRNEEQVHRSALREQIELEEVEHDRHGDHDRSFAKCAGGLFAFHKKALQ